MPFALIVQRRSHANSWESPSFLVWFLFIMEGGPSSPLEISLLSPFVWHNVEGSASNRRCHFTTFGLTFSPQIQEICAISQISNMVLAK